MKTKEAGTLRQAQFIKDAGDCCSRFNPCEKYLAYLSGALGSFLSFFPRMSKMIHDDFLLSTENPRPSPPILGGGLFEPPISGHLR